MSIKAKKFRATTFNGNGHALHAPAGPLKLNLGSGPNKMPGFLSVDSIAFPGVDVVANLNERWPWADSSVSEANASHVVEHFDAMGRVHFVNELYRVLVPGGKCQIVVPHWASCRAYGDPTHQWPPVSEFWFYYLSREWRMGASKQCPVCQGLPKTPACGPCGGNGILTAAPNAPHTDAAHLKGGFECDFEATWGYSFHQSLAVRNQEYQQFAMQWYKEAAQDTIATLTSKKT